MKKKPVGSTQIAEKPLTIIVTVMPPKRGLRTMIVSAAREGEMPLVLGGPFADRHHLLDQAYAGVLKREPQVVTVSKQSSVGSRQSKAGDQLVEGETTPSQPPPSQATGEEQEELPVIEGDDAPAADELSDISLPAGEAESDGDEVQNG